jgi:hypothetical protein
VFDQRPNYYLVKLPGLRTTATTYSKTKHKLRNKISLMIEKANTRGRIVSQSDEIGDKEESNIVMIPGHYASGCSSGYRGRSSYSKNPLRTVGIRSVSDNLWGGSGTKQQFHTPQYERL